MVALQVDIGSQILDVLKFHCTLCGRLFSLLTQTRLPHSDTPAPAKCDPPTPTHPLTASLR